MSRKLLALLIASGLLLALFTYIYYRRTLAAVPLDPYALVPDDAVLVISTNDHPRLVRHLQETQLWDNLTAVRYFQQGAGHLALADSLAGGSRRRGGLLALLGHKLVITSLHVTGPAAFDVLYQVPLSQVSEYRQVRGLLETLGRDHRYRLSTRLFEDQELNVLTERRTEESLTVLNYRNHLLLSTNADLVEAAVRRMHRPNAPTVRAAFGTSDVLRLPDVDAGVLLNYRRLPQFLDILFRPGSHRAIDQLAGLASEGQFGLKLAGGQVELVGFSNPETARGTLQGRLRGQPAQALGLAGLLSTRTALLLHLAARPAGTWPVAAARRAAPVDTTNARSTAPQADSANVGVALDSLQRSLGPELALAYLAAATPGSAAGRLAYVRCPNPARTRRWLARLRRLQGTSPAFARIGTYELHPIGFGAQALLGPLADIPTTALNPATAAVVDGYLLLGDAAALAAALTDVVAGRSWAGSPAQVAFLAQALPRARASIFVDAGQAWNGLLGALTEERRAGLLRNETLVKRFPQMAWQLRPAPDEAAPDAQYYTQLLLRHPALTPEVGSDGRALASEAGRGLRFGQPLRGVPLALPAAGTRRPAAAVQDSAGVLRYISADNVVLWADTLGSARTPVVGLGTLPMGGSEAGPGLLLATGPRLHWLRPDGREASNFPLTLPDSARIRDVVAAPGGPGGAWLLAATAGPALRLLDAQGREYPGWQPKLLDFPLAGRPALLNINGRVVVLAPLQNGYLYAFDAQGGLLPGFPLSVGARLAGGLLVEPGSTLSRTRITLVNQHGEVLRLSLGGDVLSRTRAATWSRTAVFRLVPDQRGASFVVTRLDGNRLDVFAPGQATPLLSRSFITSGDKPVQLFDFGPAHRVLALSEPGPGQVFLFDGKGQALGGPLPSTGTGVGLTYDATANTYHLLRLVGQELRRSEVGE